MTIEALEPLSIDDEVRCSAPAARTDGSLKSVAHALDLLDCFATSEQLGVSDIARRLGVAKSTAHRLLTTLCARGLAEQDPDTGLYHLGLHLFELGQLAQSRITLRRKALPLLEELRQVSGRTVHLAIADGGDVVYLERLETLTAIPLMADVVRRWPVHCTASGKAIAAFDETVATERRRLGFPRATQSTIHDVASFDRELAEVRRVGVAISRGEHRGGLISVAAPVRDSLGRARAAISMVGPAQEMAHDLGRPARLVTAAARRLAGAVAV